MQSVVEKINGLMIYHTTKNFSIDKIERESEMNEISIPCARFMGSLSIIFVKTPSGMTYLYRGSSNMWPGLISEEHSFADEVDYSEISVWCQTSRKCIFKDMINNIVPVNDKRFIYNSMIYNSFPYLSLNSDYKIFEVRFLLNQARILLSSVEANKLRDTLSSRFMDELKSKKEHIQTSLKKTIEEMKNSDASFITHYTATIMAIKRSTKEIDKEHIKLFELVESFASERLTSKRNVSIQQIQRKNVIQNNVAIAENMSTEQFGEMLMNSTECCIVSELQTHDFFYDMLMAVSQSNIRNYLTQCSNSFSGHIQHKQNLPLLCASEKCLSMESDIIPSLLQHNTESHYLTSDGVQMTFVLQGKSCIVFPIFSNSDFVKGKYINWMDESNASNVATWRICFRKSLRLLHLRIPIDKQSQDLNVAIQLIILSTAWSLSLTMNKENVEFSNTTSELMRGLLYLWGTTCAAGDKPFSFAFTMLNQAGKVQVPKTKEEYILYGMVVYLYPFTGINSNFIVKNTRIFIIKVLRKQFVDAVTEPMRKSLDEMKEKQSKNTEIERNIALQWNQAAATILKKLIENIISEEKAQFAAHTLLHLKPDKPTYTTEKLERSLTILKIQGRTGLSEDIVKKTIADSTAKRGTIMMSAKKNIMAIKNPKNKSSSTSTLILTKRKQVLMSQMSVKDFKIQNWDAFANYDISKMKGDAELKRTPFKIKSQHSIPDSRTYSSLMNEALNLSISTVSASKQLATYQEEDTLISRLSKIPKSQDAISLAQKLHALNFENVFESTSCLFIDAAKLKNDNKNAVLQNVVSCLLDNWRDLTKGEEACLSMFE
tara:strand:- start:2136 stop:4622 length:2487 start_codon:yes stop_codon:yes gene_type:complete